MCRIKTSWLDEQERGSSRASLQTVLPVLDRHQRSQGWLGMAQLRSVQ